jgi:hypothetical protein
MKLRACTSTRSLCTPPRPCRRAHTWEAHGLWPGVGRGVMRGTHDMTPCKAPCKRLRPVSGCVRQVMRHGVWAAMSKAWLALCVFKAGSRCTPHTQAYMGVGRSDESTYPCIRRARPWQHVERAGGCGARTRWRPYGMTSRLVRGGRGILCMGRPVPVVAPGINPTQACPASSAVQCRALHAAIGALVCCVVGARHSCAAAWKPNAVCPLMPLT